MLSRTKTEANCVCAKTTKKKSDLFLFLQTPIRFIESAAEIYDCLFFLCFAWVVVGGESSELHAEDVRARLQTQQWKKKHPLERKETTAPPADSF